MEIVNIETRTYEAMLSRFEAFVGNVENIFGRPRDKRLEKWLDNQDVCQILNISKRTLQSYRAQGLLPSCRMNYKILYKPEDVEKLLQASAHPVKTCKP